MKNNTTIKKILRYSLLILVGLFMVYPLLWMIGSSFKPNSEIFSSMGVIPKNPTVDGYVKGWQTSTEYTFTRYFANSLTIVIPKVILTIVSSTLAAYGFARFKFRGRKVMFTCMIATLMLPNVVLRIPQYIMYNSLGWLDSYKPLIVPSAFATDAFFVYMIVQYIRGLPTDLEQAARIDGCNSFETLIYILVPVIKPAIISCGLFQFMWTMNDFMGPLIYLSSVKKFPISIALKMSMDASSAVDWTSILAMSVIALLPSLIVFFLGQKYFVDGVSSSGMK